MQNTKYSNSLYSEIERLKSVDFILPSELEATQPPEARGLKRDEVKLMISYKSDNKIIHDKFYNLDNYLESGDLIVINTSKTMSSAIDVERHDGSKLRLHISTHLPSNLWVVELRNIEGNNTKPFYDINIGEILNFPQGGNLIIHSHYVYQLGDKKQESKRLWIASLNLPMNISEYLKKYGKPIRYSYVTNDWDIDYYQTVYANNEGSAEMPSAGRAFSFELITKLVARGVKIAPLVLHTGVSSLESDELPYEEFYDIPLETAKIINQTKKAKKKVIAAGTTVIRALETVIDYDENIHPGKGLTNILITPEKTIKSVNAMLTGLHEPRATHLSMLQGLVSLDHINKTYQEAIEKKYLWHEFGDLHLLLP